MPEERQDNYYDTQKAGNFGAAEGRILKKPCHVSTNISQFFYAQISER